MRIFLDLLPEEQKEEIKKRKLYKNILNQECRLLFPLVLFFFMLVAINFNLNIQYENLKSFAEIRSNREEIKKIKKFEEVFADANAKLILLSNINKKSIRWSNVLFDISSIVPDGVYLTSFTTSDYILKITGRSANRDNFMLFQDKIKASACFKIVNMPLQNLVAKEDSIFELELEVKKECLNK